MESPLACVAIQDARLAVSGGPRVGLELVGADGRDVERARLELICRVWAAERRALIAWGVRVLRRPAGQVEDLYQEVYLRALGSCRSSAPSAIRAFLRQGLWFIDREWRRRARELTVAPEDLDVAGGSSEGDPCVIVLERERHQRARRAFATLGAQQLEAVSLAVLDGLSRAEIQAQTGLSARQLKRYRERCRGVAWRVLQSEYGPFCPAVLAAVQVVAFTAELDSLQLRQARGEIAGHTPSCERCQRSVARLARDRVTFAGRLRGPATGAVSRDQRLGAGEGGVDVAAGR